MSLHQLNLDSGELTDKGTRHNYLITYEKEMEKTDNVKLLEIGVWYGGSLQLWSKWFTNSDIYGIDNFAYPIFGGNPPEKALSPLYTVLTVDSQVKEQCPFEDNMFDYIVDDALHDHESILKTFDIYWPKVKSGGKYFIEDIIDDKELGIITQRLEGLDYRVFDTRATHSSDDLLVVITKV